MHTWWSLHCSRKWKLNGCEKIWLWCWCVLVQTVRVGARKTLHGRDRKSRICSFGLTQWKIKQFPLEGAKYGVVAVDILKFLLCDLWQRSLTLLFFIQYNTISLFKEGSAITYYSFLTYGPFLFCLGFRMSETLVYLLFFLPTGKLLEWLLMFNPSYTGCQVTCINTCSHTIQLCLSSETFNRPNVLSFSWSKVGLK